ncbi:putative membrane protein [Yersinia rohdei]|uniref:Membrane protein n=1 Tax=Yersinia rohdei TaxID=29485 RepID=A0ABM5S9W0_YERRO|nr:putative membrane protein [Yersinia rohdei]
MYQKLKIAVPSLMAPFPFLLFAFPVVLVTPDILTLLPRSPLLFF